MFKNNGKPIRILIYLKEYLKHYKQVATFVSAMLKKLNKKLYAFVLNHTNSVRSLAFITQPKSWAFPMEICHGQNVHRYLSFDRLDFVDLNPFKIKHLLL